jgi:hypothetical protein
MVLQLAMITRQRETNVRTSVSGHNDSKAMQCEKKEGAKEMPHQ